MSILAEVFVSTKSDALRYEVETKSGHEPAAERFEVVRYSRLTSLEFGTLWAILESAEWDVNRHMLKSLAHSDETWLEEFPDSYVSLLASAEEDHLLSASKAWGASEELQCAGEELVPILRDLRRLAVLANANGKGLFLWGSL